MSTDETPIKSKKENIYFTLIEILLFPLPSFFTILRPRDASGAKHIFHFVLGIFLIISIALFMLLQIFARSLSLLWMTAPFLLGPIMAAIFWRNRPQPVSSKNLELYKKHAVAVLILSIFLAALNIIPHLDFIDIQNVFKANNNSQWVEKIGIWPYALISMLGAITVLAGYLAREPQDFSFDKAIILYACYLGVSMTINMIALPSYIQLNNRIGLGFSVVFTFLAAFLTGDYVSKNTFGEHLGAYFTRTAPKLFYFFLIWLNCIGLPQKLASAYAVNRYKEIKPIPRKELYHDFLFPKSNSHANGHNLAQKLRFLYSESLLSDQADQLAKLSEIIAENEHSICPNAEDVCALKNLIENGLDASGLSGGLEAVFLRPIQMDWDVFLAAMSMQQGADVDFAKQISSFKAKLPKAAEGELPSLQYPHDAQLAAYAAGQEAVFVQPTFQNLKTILDNKLIPIALLSLTGKKKWGAVLSVDEEKKLAVVRLGTRGKIHNNIQRLFDSDKAQENKSEILSRMIVFIPLESLRETIEDGSSPIIAVANADSIKKMEAAFGRDYLSAMEAVAASDRRIDIVTDSASKKPATGSSADTEYLRSITKIKQLLDSGETDYEALLSNNRAEVYNWEQRIGAVEKIIDAVGELKEKDRLDIGYLLAKERNIQSTRSLFLRLTDRPIKLNGLVDCRETYAIGKNLYLLGRYEAAFRYLELAYTRHPLAPNYERWFKIAALKANGEMLDEPAGAPSDPGLALYHKTLIDIENGEQDQALERLEAAVDADSYDSMANHLLNRYFGRPLNSTYFFDCPEGL